MYLSIAIGPHRLDHLPASEGHNTVAPVARSLTLSCSQAAIATWQIDNPSKPVTHMSSEASTLLIKMTRMSGGSARPEVWRWLPEEPAWPGARTQVTTPQLAREMRREGWGTRGQARDSATALTRPPQMKACPIARRDCGRRCPRTARAVSAVPVNRGTRPTLAQASLTCPRGRMPKRLFRGLTRPRSEKHRPGCATVIRRRLWL